MIKASKDPRIKKATKVKLKVAKRKELLMEQATIILMRLIIKATNRTSRIQAEKKIRRMKVRPKVKVMTKAQTAKPMAIMAKPKVQIAPMTKTMIVTMPAAKRAQAHR